MWPQNATQTKQQLKKKNETDFNIPITNLEPLKQIFARNKM